MAVADPSFAQDYTTNKAKFASTPAALAGFQHHLFFNRQIVAGLTSGAVKG